jgi:hypothetical protein
MAVISDDVVLLAVNLTCVSLLITVLICVIPTHQADGTSALKPSRGCAMFKPLRESLCFHFILSCLSDKSGVQVNEIVRTVTSCSQPFMHPSIQQLSHPHIQPPASAPPLPTVLPMSSILAMHVDLSAMQAKICKIISEQYQVRQLQQVPVLEGLAFHWGI